MNWLDRAVLALAPEAGLRRVRAKRAASALMHYDVAQPGRRTRSIRPNGLDADAAADRRQRIAFVSRDMRRNNPIAVRALEVVAANTVGDGILPSISGVPARTRARFEAMVAQHFDTTAIDADGVLNLYGIQRVAMNTIAGDGEVLIRIRRRASTEGLALPFQLQLLEPDFLDESMDIAVPQGALIRNGIEYDARGRRVAYHLYDEHPGSMTLRSPGRSRRVPASEVIHVYRVDRPGQQRGVSWLAPVAMQLQDLADYLDAQLVRQKLAACFVAFRVTPDGEPSAPGSDPLDRLSPGLVHQLPPGEDVRFAEPPGVSGMDEFTRTGLRAVAAGVGITYESLSGDLGGVNFSSGRMGRMEMDRNITAWQWLMLIPQMMNRISALTLESWSQMPGPIVNLSGAAIEWTPPARVIVDPAKEYGAMVEAIRSGLRSWQATVRSLGYDPEDVAREIAEDAARFDALGLTVESDARVGKAGGPAPAALSAPRGDAATDADTAD